MTERATLPARIAAWRAAERELSAAEDARAAEQVVASLRAAYAAAFDAVLAAPAAGPRELLSMMALVWCEPDWPAPAERGATSDERRLPLAVRRDLEWLAGGGG